MNFSSKIKTLLEHIINDSNIVLIGEIHGAKENLDFYKFMINFYLKNKNDFPIICFEWNSILEKRLNNNKKLLNKSAQKYVTKNYILDGRFCIDHIKFLNWYKNISNNKGYIICYDQEGKFSSWNEREKLNFLYLKNKMELLNDKFFVIIGGNLHIRPNKFYINNEKYTPLGWYFKKLGCYFLNIEYKEGYVFNVKRKKVSSFEKGDIVKLSRRYYKLIFKKAHPCKMIK